MCSSRLKRYLLQRKKVWIDSNIITEDLYCTNANNRSVLVFTNPPFWVRRKNDSSRQSNLLCFQFSVCPVPSMRVTTYDHRTAPPASWQLPCRRIFVKCLCMFATSQSLVCCASCWDYFPISLTESDWHKLWLWRSFNLTGDCPPVVCALGRPQLNYCGDNAAPDIWWSVSVRTDGRA